MEKIIVTIYIYLEILNETLTKKNHQDLFSHRQSISPSCPIQLILHIFFVGYGLCIEYVLQFLQKIFFMASNDSKSLPGKDNFIYAIRKRTLGSLPGELRAWLIISIAFLPNKLLFNGCFLRWCTFVVQNPHESSEIFTMFAIRNFA